MAANQQETKRASASSNDAAASLAWYGGLSYLVNRRFCHQLGPITVLAALALVPPLLFGRRSG